MIVADASGKRPNLTFASADPPDLNADEMGLKTQPEFQ
jgi:hypothetical protein